MSRYKASYSHYHVASYSWWVRLLKPQAKVRWVVFFRLFDQNNRKRSTKGLCHSFQAGLECDSLWPTFPSDYKSLSFSRRVFVLFCFVLDLTTNFYLESFNSPTSQTFKVLSVRCELTGEVGQPSTSNEHKWVGCQDGSVGEGPELPCTLLTYAPSLEPTWRWKERSHHMKSLPGPQHLCILKNVRARTRTCTLGRWGWF